MNCSPSKTRAWKSRPSGRRGSARLARLLPLPLVGALVLACAPSSSGVARVDGSAPSDAPKGADGGTASPPVEGIGPGIDRRVPVVLSNAPETCADVDPLSIGTRWAVSVLRPAHYPFDAKTIELEFVTAGPGCSSTTKYEAQLLLHPRGSDTLEVARSLLGGSLDLDPLSDSPVVVNQLHLRLEEGDELVLGVRSLDGRCLSVCRGAGPVPSGKNFFLSGGASVMPSLFRPSSMDQAPWSSAGANFMVRIRGFDRGVN